MKTLDWLDHKACTDNQDADFFPDTPSRAPAAYRRARTTCMACPVRAQCLEAALAEERGVGRPMRFGMRGGLSPTQRHDLERQIAEVAA